MIQSSRAASVPTTPSSIRLKTACRHQVTCGRRHQLRREKRPREPQHERHLRDRERKTREVLTQRYYQVTASHLLRFALTRVPGSRSALYFFGSWRQVNSPIKGHMRGGLSAFKKNLAAPENDLACLTSEYSSTKSCCYCLQPVRLHKYRRGDKLTTVAGAVTCLNRSCPAKSHPTRNRDSASSYNIALIGVLASLDPLGPPILPFR